MAVCYGLFFAFDFGALAVAFDSGVKQFAELFCCYHKCIILYFGLFFNSDFDIFDKLPQVQKIIWVGCLDFFKVLHGN